MIIRFYWLKKRQQVRQVKSVSGQTVDFERDNLPAGIYLIRLTQDNTCYTGRVMIVP